MSYSRWKDDRFFPLFRNALLRTREDIGAAALERARDYNMRRYQFQGIGRYEPDAAYARGVADLQTVARLIPDGGFVFGGKPSSVDAAIYGCTANVYFYNIDTPLRDCVLAHPNMVRHCEATHAAVR